MPFTQQAVPKVSEVITLLTDATVHDPADPDRADALVRVSRRECSDLRRVPDRDRSGDEQGVVDDPKRLAQDTVVVLTTTFLMALFLLWWICSGAGC